MSSSKNILDFFKVQNTNFSCPACGISLPKSRLNIHLDSDCTSSAHTIKDLDYVSSEICSTSGNKTFVLETNLKSKRNTKIIGSSKVSSKTSSKTGRLSLKQQKLNAKKKELDKTNNLNTLNCAIETEVITIDDDESSKNLNNADKNYEKNNCQYKKVNTVQIDSNSELDLENINNKFESFDQRERKLFDANVDIESQSLNNVTKSECLILQNAELNDDQRCINSETENKQKSLNSMKSVAKIFLDSNHSSIKVNSHCVKNEKLSDPVRSVSNNFPINILFENAEENKLVNDSQISADTMAVLKDAEEFLEVDDNVFTENSGKSENYSPYYIANFRHILNTVLNDDYNKILFNDEDMSFIKAFEASSDSAQKLYVRLFQRKYNWLRLNKINYPKITQDTKIVLDELVSVGLVDLGLDKFDLETSLDLLSLPEARNVAKQFKINSSSKSKKDITLMLLKHSKEHKSVFFCNGKNSISNMILKKVKDVLGSCYRIALLPKRLFTRILMLFSLPTMSEDDDDAAGGQQQQLLTLLQVNKGEVTFPAYKIYREKIIFIERDELIRYEEAKQLENDIMNAVESKDFHLAKELYFTAKDEFENQLTCPFVERAASLPTFLKKYTSFHVYIRCLTQGVEIFQRLREYKEAVDLLQRLLDQTVFCQDYRGRWLDRMALNLEQHLKQPHQALEAIKKGIKDKNVRVGHRYSLLTRALRILKSTDKTDELKNEILKAANVIEAPKIVIRGRLFPRNILGRRHVFISSSSALTDEDDITVLGVEQLAIEHYKNEGFTEGIHGEGSTFHSLYGLLFWDIIYDGSIPDAFISPYQTHPLDLNHDSFFVRRKKQILNHLETLRASTTEELKAIVKSTWEAHFGQSSLVMWDRFTDVEHVLGLVSCMSNHVLCGICERLARDFRFTRSGVPDLVVWNPESLQVKIVEVKGPGDKLSSKQILWLDYLLKLEAQAEVCLVEAVGSKKLRRE